MPTYAQASDLEAYVEGWVTDNPAAVDRLLERAERDIDYAAGAWPIADPVNGLKFVPGSLAAWQTKALVRATCAQAEYRFEMGEEFMVKAQHARVQGPDFAAWGRLPYIGPKALRELVSGGLLRGAGAYATVSYGSCSSGGDVIGNL
jgi:hypothetical protein